MTRKTDNSPDTSPPALEPRHDPEVWFRGLYKCSPPGRIESLRERAAGIEEAASLGSTYVRTAVMEAADNAAAALERALKHPADATAHFWWSEPLKDGVILLLEHEKGVLEHEKEVAQRDSMRFVRSRGGAVTARKRQEERAARVKEAHKLRSQYSDAGMSDAEIRSKISERMGLTAEVVGDYLKEAPP